MMRCLVLLLALCAGLAADECTVPGNIEFFPLYDSTKGQCHPSAFNLTTANAATVGQCTYCGPSVALPSWLGGASLDDAAGIIGSSALCSAFSHLPAYTMSFNFSYDVLGNGLLPGGTLWSRSYADGLLVQNNEIQLGSDGHLTWANDSVEVDSHNHASLVVPSDIPLEGGQCYYLSFISDGAAYYLYINGELAGGPVQHLPVPWGTISDMKFCRLQGGPNFISNIGFARTAVFPTENPTPVACVSPTPTPTQGCKVIIIAPPDITFGAVHTVIQTCTAVPTLSPTISPTPTGGCPQVVVLPPDLTVGVVHTRIVTCTMVETETATRTMTMTSSPSPSATMTKTPGACGAACSNGATRIGQGSPNPWATVQVDSTSGAHDTIAYIGCFLTCYSMIDPEKRTPAQLNTLFDDNGYFDDGGGLSDPKDAANSIGFDYAQRNVTGTAATDLIATNVCSPNTYLVVQVSNSSHFVLVTGQEYDPSTKKCRFTINDPSHANHTFLDEYTDGGERPVATVRIFTKQ